jgi:hypothetical protein
MSEPAVRRPTLHVHVMPGTRAEQAYLVPRTEAATPRAITGGIVPNPDYDLQYQGGKTIPDLTFTFFYVGGDASWSGSDRGNIDRALSAAMADRNLNNVMQQYFSTPISATFRPSTVLTGAPPKTFTQADAENTIKSLFNAGQLAGYDFGTTVFGMILPRGSILTDDSSAGNAGVRSARVTSEDTAVSSLEGLGGYHGVVVAGNTTLYYAVVVYGENLGNGKMNGIAAFAEPWKNICGAMYHELQEARTDPDINGTPGWVSNPVSDFGGQSVEVGDAPVFEAGKNLGLVFKEVPLADGSGTVPIQLMYSDAVHGPEGPRDTADPAASTTGGGGVGGGSPIVIIGIIVSVLILLGLGYFLFIHK